ncbi:MAG: exodeoxyribonuclease V subunit gamma, partial [Polyangiaceae bacterium]|nr:exodeoxyribonuclease V subunit gamma [Polyangiaceae bacterium]
MLHIYRSNRVEVLAHALAARLHASPLPDPLEPERVVVATHGMAQWLSQRLSHQLGSTDGTADGICANVVYPFPRQAVDELLCACLGPDPGQSDPWSPDRLTWSVLRELPGLLGDEAFSQLRTYLGAELVEHGDGVVGRRAFGLARRLADLLDQYALMRADMVRAWSRGELAGAVPGQPLPPEHRWQAELWRRLEQALHVQPLSERFRQAIARLTDPTQPVPTMPQRLSFFGLSALPPMFLELLGAASRHVHVDLYLLCPSAAFWSDIQAKREQLRHCRVLPDPAELALREGNPVLASLGRLGRDFQIALERLDEPYALQGTDLFVDPEQIARREARAPTMLELLQADILHLRNRGARGALQPDRHTVESTDTSIRVHACHGAIRQVEVLRDALLRLMSEDPSIEPRDILVLTPDIARFAPLVAAVFADGCPCATRPAEGWGLAGAPELPFQVTDRCLRETNPVAGALMHILDMVPGRVPASAVLDLLAFEPVRRRFGLGDDDLHLVQRWIRESGIRWGVDGEHRKTHDQPCDDANSWRFGLDRLLLGAAMPDEGERMFGSTVPFDDMEGAS